MFSNKDLPGVIGGIGTILGKRGINIARFSLGREYNGPASGSASLQDARNALAIVQTDVTVPNAVLEEIRNAVPAVQAAKTIYL